MIIERLSNQITQIFSRFFISGLVFYLFVICLPSAMFFGLYNETIKIITSNATFIILVSLVIGIILDISRFYKLFWFLNKKDDMVDSIVKGFKIEVLSPKNEPDYLKKVKTLSILIHDIFIRTKQPEIFQQISDARIYPDTITMSLISIMLFGFECIIFTAVIFVEKLFNIRIHLISISANFLIYLPIIIIIIAIILSAGFKKIKQTYSLTADFTIELIKKGYNNSDEKDKLEFYESLQKENLIVNCDGDWKVEEGKFPLP